MTERRDANMIVSWLISMWKSILCLLMGEVCREPPQAVPLPAGGSGSTWRSVEPPRADCGQSSRSITCSQLLRNLKQVQVALRAVEEREEALAVR